MTPESKKVKLVLTVPLSHSDVVRKSIGDAGAWRFETYSHCSVSMPVTGRFLPLDGADPHIGAVGKPEEVHEERIEVTCDIDIIQQVITAMKSVHPYEEVAYDVYPLLGY
jgi:hypothetical protein